VGKSDPYVFSWYKKKLPKIDAKNIAILGSTTESFVRDVYHDAKIDLFDIQFKNWNINDESWNINKNVYDVVVCTRCAYFSKEPKEFIRKCKELLKDHGVLFLDWGLGDHWRFEKFKVGWIIDSEHEYAQYGDIKSFVFSSVWNDDWEDDVEVLLFKENIKKFGYDENISKILEKEVPSLYNINEKCEVSFMTLWPEKPQLYYITKFMK